MRAAAATWRPWCGSSTPRCSRTRATPTGVMPRGEPEPAAVRPAEPRSGAGPPASGQTADRTTRSELSAKPRFSGLSPRSVSSTRRRSPGSWPRTRTWPSRCWPRPPAPPTSSCAPPPRALAAAIVLDRANTGTPRRRGIGRMQSAPLGRRRRPSTSTPRCPRWPRPGPCGGPCPAHTRSRRPRRSSVRTSLLSSRWQARRACAGA